MNILTKVITPGIIAVGKLPTIFFDLSKRKRKIKNILRKVNEQ
jgi:hypothetical protein